MNRFPPSSGHWPTKLCTWSALVISAPTSSAFSTRTASTSSSRDCDSRITSAFVRTPRAISSMSFSRCAVISGSVIFFAWSSSAATSARPASVGFSWRRDRREEPPHDELVHLPVVRPELRLRRGLRRVDRRVVRGLRAPAGRANRRLLEDRLHLLLEGRVAQLLEDALQGECRRVHGVVRAGGRDVPGRVEVLRDPHRVRGAEPHPVRLPDEHRRVERRPPPPRL